MFIKTKLLTGFLLIFLFQCKKEEEEPVQLETYNITSVTTTMAHGGGRVFLPDENQILARGICWDTTPQPTLNGCHSTYGKGNGIFNSVRSHLEPFYYRYVDTEYWNTLGRKYHLTCDTVSNSCVPYEVKDIQPVVKQEFAPSGNSIFPE